MVVVIHQESVVPPRNGQLLSSKIGDLTKDVGDVPRRSWWGRDGFWVKPTIFSGNETWLLPFPNLMIQDLTDLENAFDHSDFSMETWPSKWPNCRWFCQALARNSRGQLSPRRPRGHQSRGDVFDGFPSTKMAINHISPGKKHEFVSSEVGILMYIHYKNYNYHQLSMDDGIPNGGSVKRREFSWMDQSKVSTLDG